MDRKFNFKILIPVWGEEYSDLFCHAGLPSLLSVGNIPELAKKGDLKICFLTTKASVELFSGNASFQKLKSFGGVTFTFIDDLLDIENYGLLLTFAYERGIIEETPEVQLNTFFIFLNADFVLSNNAFTTLLRYINEGKNAIVTPSLRCNKEDVIWQLQERLSVDELSLSSRELVRLALDNLHPTVLAKIVNQEFFHCFPANQFYWSVDSNTLIGRFFLMFMFCIKPEKILKKASNYCDYSFVPDLCPSGNYSIIEDSDELFLLELSTRNQESEFLRPGKMFPPQLARILSHWTTVEHRLYSKKTLIFHAEPRPALGIEGIKQLDLFMDQIYSLLSPVISHINHPYWLVGLELLKNKRYKYTYRDDYSG